MTKKKQKEKWEEEFKRVKEWKIVRAEDGSFNIVFGESGSWSIMPLKGFISDHRKKAQKEILEKVKKEGYGGGNWRRVIEQNLEALKEKLKKEI